MENPTTHNNITIGQADSKTDIKIVQTDLQANEALADINKPDSKNDLDSVQAHTKADAKSIQAKKTFADSMIGDTVLAEISPQATTCFAANTLAFVGDAVFTLFIRRRLAKLNLKAGELTRMAARQVSATSQSQMLDKILDILTDAEKDIVRRCRNAHTNNHAKNASIVDYRRATGLEGLIGHLYLSGDSRLELILNKCLEDK